MRKHLTLVILATRNSDRSALSSQQKFSHKTALETSGIYQEIIFEKMISTSD